MNKKQKQAFRRIARENGAQDISIVSMPKLPDVRELPVLKVGDRVIVPDCLYLGVGTVIRFEPDGRMVCLSFYGKEGWWSKRDLKKVSDASTD